MTGIVSYGFYIPQYRIKIDEIATQWGKNPLDVEKSLQVAEKTVSGIDEDSLTMAFEASSMALNSLSIKREQIGAVFVGSESHPYVVNPTSTILAEFLGIRGNYLALDSEFACKAATGAMISGIGLVKSKFTPYVLVCAADKAQSRPHDALEYTAASAATAFVLGNQNVILEIVDCASFSTDTPDFWRREGIRYPSHGGRFTGKPSYFYHIQNASQTLLTKAKMKPKDFKYAVFHMPNGKFPNAIATSLGFTKEQVSPSLIVSNLGNSYTASALMGLVSVLEVAKPGDAIFFASFGSGAGSDAFIFKVTKHIEKQRQNLSQKIKDKKYIDYPTYLKYMGII